MGRATATHTMSRTLMRRASATCPRGWPSGATMCPRRAVSRSKSARRWRRGAPATRTSASKLARDPGGEYVLDPKLLRNDLPKVAAELARRGFALDVGKMAALEEQRKLAQIEADGLRAGRNA